MKLTRFIPAIILILSGLTTPHANALISIDTVYVGDINNPSDPNTGRGTVDYGYYLGKYEVTINQYVAFLNSVARTDTYGLWSSQMSAPPPTRGISRSGVSGSYTYAAIGTGTRPITYLSWLDSARFVNWLNNGQPVGLQSAATTETGAYNLNGSTTSGEFSRTANARYCLPSDNEWYKAAYYQPAANGGDVDNYWLYPTRSNVQPNSRPGNSFDPNSANYYYNDGIANGYNGGYAVNNSTDYITESVLFPVGSFTLASGYYGTFDMAGNVAEWTEFVSSGFHSSPGGSYISGVDTLQAVNYYNVASPTAEYGSVGFRIALVPEPCITTLLSLGVPSLVMLRRRGNIRFKQH